MALGGANVGTNLTLYDNFLKEWYMSGWTDLLNNLTTTYKLSRKRIVNYRGRRMIIALRTKKTGAIGPMEVSGYTGAGTSAARALRDPGYQGIDNANVRPKLVTGAIGIPQDVIDQSASDRGAFYEVVDFEMMGLKTDMANYLDRVMYQGGQPNGQVRSAPTGTTVSVDNPYRFYTGQLLQGFNGFSYTSPIRNSGDPYTVTAVDIAGETITLDTVSGLSDDDYLYTNGARSDGAAGSGVSFEPLGFQELIKGSKATGDGDLTTGDLTCKTYDGTDHMFGISRTVDDSAYVAEWASTATAVSGDVEFSDLHALNDDIHDSSGGDPSIYLCNRKVRRHLASRMSAPGGTAATATQRFENTTKLKGGYIGRKEDHHGQTGSDWVLFDDRMPIIVDRYAPYDYEANTGTIFAIDTRHCFWALVTDWKWWAPEGRILREQIASSGHLFGVLAHAYMFGEHVLDNPSTCGRLHGFTTTAA